MKHADADNAYVRLKYNQKCIFLEVEDDGIGFVLGVTLMGSARPAWGLAGMRERATLLDGKFDVQSEVGKGTRIAIMVPTDTEGEGCDEYPFDPGR